MFHVERLAKIIANKISSKLELDNEQREVVAYGAFSLIQTILSILLVVLFGLLFNVALEALIISFIVSILRKYSGGVHASTSDICMILGTVIFIGLAKVVSITESLVSVELVLVVILLSFSWTYYIVFKLAPVASVTKPISKQKRKRMKKGSILILIVYLLIALSTTISYYWIRKDSMLTYCLCICVGVVWQIFTLTKTGHVMLNKIDTFLSNILSFKGGK